MKCEHCGKECVPVELSFGIRVQINALGVESLSEVDQAVYEGLVICEDCYNKEKGL